MSITAIKWAFAQRNISPPAKFVLVALADHHNAQSDQCWPSVARIVEHTNYATRTIFNAVDELTAAGLVMQTPRPGTSNLYRLAMGEVCISNTPPMQEVHTTPATDAQEVCTPCIQTVKNHKGTVTEPRAHAKKLPADWEPTPKLLEWAKERAPHVDTATETEKFINYFLNGPARLSWEGSWRNWIIRAVEGYGHKTKRQTTRMDGQRSRNNQLIDEALARRKQETNGRRADDPPQLRLITGSTPIT